MKNSKSQNLMKTIRRLYKRNGTKGFFVGNTSLTSVVYINSIGFFYFYELFKVKIKERNMENNATYFLAAGIARALSNCISAPLEFKATYSQAHMSMNKLFKQKSLLNTFY